MEALGPAPPRMLVAEPTAAAAALNHAAEQRARERRMKAPVHMG